MALSTARMRASLQAFNFKQLFVEELGWANYTARIASITLDGLTYNFAPVAEQGGMVVMTCTVSDGNIPPSGARHKIDKHITGLHFEHLIIFLDRDANGTAQTSRWWWVKREDDKLKPRTFEYRRGAMGDALLQKLAGIAFDISELDAEGKVSIADVTGRVTRAFDVETVTKRFYDRFKTEHTAFLGFLKGVTETGDRDWYASVMLNRLMFLYFIQRKGFLNGDLDYLRTKLNEVEAAGQNFYSDFLLILFFEGLAREEGERDEATNRLLGKIPYLNGGLFLPHPLEDKYGNAIAVENAAFDRLFDFFAAYTWHLDDRPLQQGNEINPDVLGYIFEKYINQKQMGAYYTKEDITGYICRSTILPFLLDKCGVDIQKIMTDVEPYIFDAVSTEKYLPTETEREYVVRRKRYEAIKADFAAGKIAAVDDLVTYNLDIETLAKDWLLTLDDPVMLRQFYFECLTKLTVLDPTCGSGAFLFAAINILEPLYALALDKMRQIVGAPADAPATPAARENVFKYLDFVDELKRVTAHLNYNYYILKRIIVNNLYGVDIMDEAVEICKLRLFLKMVAQVEPEQPIEPLPDIDFNIRAGNTLVGYATKAEIEGRLFATDDLKYKVASVDRELRNFREWQTRLNTDSSTYKRSKTNIQDQLNEIRRELNAELMQDYGLINLDAFIASHKPFHWYIEFNAVLTNGGFDVIVGNPPWIEYAKVRPSYTVLNYQTERCGNLHGMVTERATAICNQGGRLSFIVQLPVVSSARMDTIRTQLTTHATRLWIATFDDRPGKLFDGLQHCRSTIFIGKNHQEPANCILAVSKYHRWLTSERNRLFQQIEFAVIKGATIHVGIFPKYANSLQETLFRRLKANSQTMVASVVSKTASEEFVFYQEATQYWIKGSIGFPFYAKNGKIGAPAHGRYLYLKDINTAHVISAILNSSLFYTYFIAYGDCFHLSDFLVSRFPVPSAIFNDAYLAQLSRTLMTELRDNATRATIRTGAGDTIEYDEYSGVKSKPIIDEIDRVLARHYGFTDEELDFIINYDIKYRMGRDADSSDGDEGAGE